MRPELFPDWSCQLLAWALAHPYRRPSWLCLCPPNTHHHHPIMLMPAVLHMTGLVLQDYVRVGVNVSSRMSHWLSCSYASLQVICWDTCINMNNVHHKPVRGHFTLSFEFPLRLCPSPPAQIKRNLFWGVSRGIMKQLPWIPSLNRLHIQAAE